MTRHRAPLVAAAIAALGSGFLSGCPSDPPYDDRSRGLRRGRWEKYRSLDAVERDSGEGRHPWDVPGERKPRQWKYVVLHHSATGEGSAESFDLYHREVKGWKGLAYHFVIGNGTYTPDGAVEVGYRWEKQTPGAHAGAREYNSYGIGICLVGDFEHSLPTTRQMAKLRALLAFLMKRFDIEPENVVRHSDVGDTRCPGKNFPWPVPAAYGKPVAGPDENLREKARKRLELD